MVFRRVTRAKLVIWTLQVLSKDPQGLPASEQKLRAALEPRICVLHFIGEKTDRVDGRAGPGTRLSTTPTS